jgi:hypothetical protein
MVSPIDSSKTSRTDTSNANRSRLDSLNNAFDNAKSAYVSIIGKNPETDRLVSNSAAVNCIFQSIGFDQSAMGFRSIVLPEKDSERPAPQTRNEFKKRLEAAERSGKRKEDLVRSNDADDIVTGYYLFVKSALYEEIELPNVKMPHIFGYDQYNVPQAIKDKVVLSPAERKNFEEWLNGGEISHAVFNKVKFAMGITDSWSPFVTGGREDVQLNAYRTAMADRGCEVLKLVCEAEEFVPIVNKWARAEEIAAKITGKPPKITQSGYIENTKY